MTDTTPTKTFDRKSINVTPKTRAKNLTSVFPRAAGYKRFANVFKIFDAHTSNKTEPKNATYVRAYCSGFQVGEDKFEELPYPATADDDVNFFDVDRCNGFFRLLSENGYKGSTMRNAVSALDLFGGYLKEVDEPYPMKDGGAAFFNFLGSVKKDASRASKTVRDITLAQPSQELPVVRAIGADVAIKYFTPTKIADLRENLAQVKSYKDLKHLKRGDARNDLSKAALIVCLSALVWTPIRTGNMEKMRVVNFSVALVRRDLDVGESAIQNTTDMTMAERVVSTTKFFLNPITAPSFDIDFTKLEVVDGNTVLFIETTEEHKTSGTYGSLFATFVGLDAIRHLVWYVTYVRPHFFKLEPSSEQDLDDAIDALARRRESPYLFITSNGTPLSNLSSSMQSLDPKLAGLDVNTLRKVYTTHMAQKSDQSVRTHAAQAIGHSPMTAARHYNYIDKKKSVIIATQAQTSEVAAPSVSSMSAGTAVSTASTFPDDIADDLFNVSISMFCHEYQSTADPAMTSLVADFSANMPDLDMRNVVDSKMRGELRKHFVSDADGAAAVQADAAVFIRAFKRHVTTGLRNRFKSLVASPRTGGQGSRSPNRGRPASGQANRQLKQLLATNKARPAGGKK